MFFETGRNSWQLSPYNFVWETLKRLDRATPAATLVTTSLQYLYNYSSDSAQRYTPKIAFLSSTTFIYIIFKICGGWAVGP